MKFYTIILPLLCSSIGGMASECPVASPCSCRYETINRTRQNTIYCFRARLQQIPYFRPSTKVWAKVNLGDNYITTVSNESFINIRFQRLDLSGNRRLVNIEHGAFQHLRDDLIEVALDENQLQRIDDKTFNNMNVLQVLSLGENILEKAPEAPSITDLNLFRNELNDSKISGDFFPNYNKIEVLKLNGNYLSSFPKTQLQRFGGNLKELNLAQNSIVGFSDQDFAGLSNLEKLDLGVNNIHTVSAELFHYVPKLTSLRIYANNISNVPDDTFRYMAKLEELLIGRNPLPYIPRDAFPPLRSLKSLSMFGNPLGNISDQAFSTITSRQLGHVDIGNTGLHSLPSKLLEPIPTLYSIHLNDNQLEEISSGFFSPVADSLQYVRLGDNRLTRMPEEFAMLTQLSTIYISNNQITNFTGNEIQSSNFRQLEMNNNKLNAFPFQMLSRLPNLWSIYVKNNNIGQLDACSIIAASALSYFYMDGNPLNCDCHLLHVKESKPSLRLSQNQGDLCCASPPELRGRRVEDVLPAYIPCNFTLPQLCPMLFSTTPVAPTAAGSPASYLEPAHLAVLIFISCYLISQPVS